MEKIERATSKRGGYGRGKTTSSPISRKRTITKEEQIRLNVYSTNADVLDFVDADMVDMKTEYGVR